MLGSGNTHISEHIKDSDSDECLPSSDAKHGQRKSVLKEMIWTDTSASLAMKGLPTATMIA